MSKKSILILGLDYFFHFLYSTERRMNGDDAYKLSILFNTQQKKHQLKKKGLKLWLWLKIGGVFLES